jgi:hypothetical protein
MYKQKSGAMMRAGYDKNSYYPFKQTPPEDSRSGFEYGEKVYDAPIVEQYEKDGTKFTKTTKPYSQTGKKTIPGEEVTEFVKPGTLAYKKWKAAVEKNPEIESRFLPQTLKDVKRGEDVGIVEETPEKIDRSNKIYNWKESFQQPGIVGGSEQRGRTGSYEDLQSAISSGRVSRAVELDKNKIQSRFVEGTGYFNRGDRYSKERLKAKEEAFKERVRTDKDATNLQKKQALQAMKTGKFSVDTRGGILGAASVASGFANAAKYLKDIEGKVVYENKTALEKWEKPFQSPSIANPNVESNYPKGTSREEYNKKK